MDGEQIIKQAIVTHLGPILDEVKRGVDSTHDFLVQEISMLKARVQTLENQVAPTQEYPVVPAGGEKKSA